MGSAISVSGKRQDTPKAQLAGAIFIPDVSVGASSAPESPSWISRADSRGDFTFHFVSVVTVYILLGSTNFLALNSL